MREQGQTLYEVLGVPPTASAAQIRTAYLDLVARYHPDRHEGNVLSDLATEKLASINAANEVLSDPQRRAAYDAELAQRWQRSRPGSARPRAAQAMIVRAIVLTLMLLILMRLAPVLLRALARLGRMLGEGAALLRGTPLVAVLFLVAVGGSVLFILRRSRARRRK